MYETLQREEADVKPKIHELRVAVFSLSQRALIGSFSSPELFKNIHQVSPNGLIGVTHEQRATTLFNNEFRKFEVPTLKMLGRLGTMLVTEEDGTSHEVGGVAVATSAPYDFRRFHFRRYDLEDIEEKAIQEVDTPGSTIIDTIDAQFLTEALPLTRPRRRR